MCGKAASFFSACTTICSPLVHEGFAAFFLHDILHALTERVGLALPGGVEARVRRRDGVSAAYQAQSNGESSDVGAHDA